MPHLTPLHRYLALVATVGLPLGAWSVYDGIDQPITVPWTGVALLAIALLIGEALPVRIHSSLAVTFAGGFTLALVLLAPLWLGLSLHLAATLIDDVRSRSRWYWLVFNVAQYSLLFSLTHWAFVLVTGDQVLSGDVPSGRQLLGLLAAGLTYLAVNHSVVTVMIARMQQTPVRAAFSANALAKVLPFGMDLAVAPLAIAALSYSSWLVPLLMLPTVIMHRNARIATQREQQALHDVLTGLPNRAMLRRRVDSLAKNLESGRAPLAVLLIDLDHFKEINDTLGHHVGDELLRDVSKRLLSVVREDDMVCRLGGDEFAILASLEPDEPLAQAEALAARFVGVLEEPFVTSGVRIDVQGSVGIAVAPEHGSTMEMLMSRADIALYKAKETRGGWSVFDPTGEEQGPERLSLLGELREGIGRGELVLHYQPKLDLRSNRVTGVEALVRWQHPRKGLLQPADFLPTAENTGLIVPMTVAVLDQALAQTRLWTDQGLGLGMTVNLSARHLTDLALPEVVASALREHGVAAELLTLDVTENGIMNDPSRSATVLHLLRELGCSIAVDDYGSGYSSLAYLRKLDLDELKIDRSFIADLTTVPGEDVLVRSTVDLGHNLGLRVLAEGVEDVDTWNALRELGCDLIQGFALARPLPAAELERWLHNHETQAAGVPGQYV